MGYKIDFSKISLAALQERIAERHLIPSQTILREDLERRILWLREKGLTTVAELYTWLRDEKNVATMIESGYFSPEYAKVLLRYIKGMIAKPRKLRDFSWISDGTITALAAVGVTTTPQLYEAVQASGSIQEYAARLGVDHVELTILVKQTDLTRVQWVNHTFARVLYEAGYDTVSRIQQSDYQTMYNEVIALNRARRLYNGNIGLNDMRFLVEVSADIELDFSY